MADKLDVYNEVITRLMTETVSCTPPEWTKGTLPIETHGVRINYSLKNCEEPGKAALSESLRDLIEELYVRMSQAGDNWRQATFSFWQEGQTLKFETNFTYDGSVSTATDRPWWKLWG